MVDLSRSQARNLGQSRITNNRDAILPTRRLDQAPDLAVAADLRNARRGDPVDETRRALGLINDAAEGIFQIKNAETARRAPAEQAKGTLDAVGGAPADARLAKSVAYQDAYYTTKAEADLTHWSDQTSQEIDDLLNKGATPADIQEHLQQKVVELRDQAATQYASANAQHALGVGLMKYVSKLESDVTTKLKARTDDELVNNTGFNLTQRLEHGEPPDQPAGSPLPAPPGVPFSLPVSGRITSRFGEGRDYGSHNGIDIAGKRGSPVGAAAPGEVIETGHDARSGNFVKLRHADGSTTSYAHLDSISVKKGQTVNGGDSLGALGQTGHATGPHVHFVYRDASGKAVDPQSAVGRDMAALGPAGAGKPATIRQDVSANFEQEFARLREAGIDPKRAKQSLINSVMLWATNPDDPHPEELMAFAMSTQKDGKTPSFTPEERQAIQNGAVTAMGYAKRKENEDRKARQDIVEQALYGGLESGRNMSATIDRAFRENTFSAEEALAWKTRFRVEQDRAIQGKANDALVTRFELQLTEPDTDVEAVREAAIGAYNTGQFGTGTAAGEAFTRIMKATSEARQKKPSRTPEAAAARGYLNDVIRPDSDDLRGNPAVAALYRGAQLEFAKRVDGGDDPMAAAQKLADEYSPKIDAALRRHPVAPSAAGNAPRPSQAPAPTSNAAALARIRQLAAERAAKERALHQNR